MKYYNKIAILSLLFLLTFSFSGCSIRNVDNGEIENNIEEDVGKEVGQEEIKTIDIDGDGLMDEEENDLGTNINKSDTDGDGISDFKEVRKYKTNPLSSDTDGDGYSDGQEIESGYDPLGDGQMHSDKDGIGDADEKKYGTDPEKFDTDGDGLSDKEEINLGRDPLIKG